LMSDQPILTLKTVYATIVLKDFSNNYCPFKHD
jgi:hypothetical protein